MIVNWAHPYVRVSVSSTIVLLTPIVATLGAWAVLDASGTWTKPNPMGANGLPAIGELENAAQIQYGMPDILGRYRARYAGKRVLVTGASSGLGENFARVAAGCKANASVAISTPYRPIPRRTMSNCRCG